MVKITFSNTTPRPKRNVKTETLPLGYEFPRGWVSVDPGDIHVGVAYWWGDECQWAREFEPAEFVDWLVPALQEGRVRLIAFEIFILYPGAELNRNQAGSTFPTCELIGVMKHLARRKGIPIVGIQASSHKDQYRLAEFKPPLKPLRAWKSYGHGSHCKDAENIGLYTINRTRDHTSTVRRIRQLPGD